MKTPIISALISSLLLVTSAGQTLAREETEVRINSPIPSPTISPPTQRDIPQRVPPTVPSEQPDIRLPGGDQYIPWCKLVPWCTLGDHSPDALILPEGQVSPTPGQTQPLEQLENQQPLN